MALPERANSPEPTPQRIPSAPAALTLFWVQNVAIILWHEPATARVVEELDKLCEPGRTKYPTGISVVHFGGIRIAQLDAETREVMARNMREHKHQVLTTAIVSPVSGFFSSTLRSVATGILVLARAQLELRLHNRAEEVLGWLPEAHQKRCGVELDRAELRRVLLHAESVMSSGAR
jgi:hypothetical protein